MAGGASAQMADASAAHAIEAAKSGVANAPTRDVHAAWVTL